MDADIKKLKKLVKFMQKEGVLTFKTQEIELSLHHTALFPKENQRDTNSTESIEKEKSQFTDEEILLWSAPGFDPQGEAN
jgi:hypothetical protein